jgi:D-alanyl-lipoteichoic acid acyltransferase DltB (MBOAT superfamily)
MAFFITPHRYRWVVLFIASYYFYMSWNPKYLGLIVFSTLVDYIAGRKIASSTNTFKRKLLLTLSLSVNLGLLFFYKYFNFISLEAGAIAEHFGTGVNTYMHQFILPVGISFYTFQTMSYTIDVYNGKIKPEKHFGIFAVFVSFFPQLVAGPIERAGNLLHQIREKKHVHFRNFQFGLIRILWGLFKKVVIADRLSDMVNIVYNSPNDYGGFQLIIATLFFAFQIYCDFSGYSDIAIGSARMFGVRLMENFRNPYFSQSIGEFWHRWHISLSTWFRDYVYIPLGGSRVIKWRWYYNLFITFVISGFLHGSNWKFLIWGAIHGGILVMESIIKRPSTSNAFKSNKFIATIKTIWIFGIVCLAWIFFRANSIEDAFLIISKIADFSQPLASQVRGQVLYLGEPLWRFAGSFLVIFLLLSLEFLINIKKISEIHIIRKKAITRWSIYTLFILVILIFGVFELKEFIYFQF